MNNLSQQSNIEVTLVDGLIKGVYYTENSRVCFRLDTTGDQNLFLDCSDLIDTARLSEDDKSSSLNLYGEEDMWDRDWYWQENCGYEDCLEDLMSLLDEDNIPFVCYVLER